MVSKEQVIPAMLNNFPEFEVTWTKHVEWWGEDEAGFYNDVGAFSRYVIDVITNNKNDSQIPKIFSFAEYLMTEGEHEVQEAIATCFLENLINATSWNTIPASSFVRFLGEESKAYCKAWDEFTGVKTEGLWDDWQT
jgi:hypothetical protein